MPIVNESLCAQYYQMKRNPSSSREIITNKIHYKLKIVNEFARIES